RDETEEVHVAAPVERGLQGGVLEEGAVGDRAIDPLQGLVEHAARADRQVPDLRVAHLPARQADRLAARLERRVRELGPQPVEHRRLGQLDGVPRAGRRAAPAVEHDQNYKLAAIRHNAVNDSTSSEAPPTSAPPPPTGESTSS